MCNCPQPLQPPNPQIQKCRLILQVLAAGLMIICGLAIAAGDIFSVFMYCLLGYMLFMSWSQFNWCFALIFFLFSITNFIQTLIIIIGLIQYKIFFADGVVLKSLYFLMSFFYFSSAIYFSHFAYRHFKSMSQQGLLDGMNIAPPGFPNANANPNANQNDNYRRMPENNTPAQQHFQGQGVMIG